MMWLGRKSSGVKMISPTGSKIRADKGGSGHYGASRKKENSLGEVISYRHNGTDYCCKPGQKVLSPITGIVRREAKPYEHDEYSGLVIEGKRLAIKMFYVKPNKGIIGEVVKLGDTVGRAQDISKKYPDVTPHIHVRITKCDPDIFIGPTDIME